MKVGPMDSREGREADESTQVRRTDHSIQLSSSPMTGEILGELRRIRKESWR
jgi:hypothetical protein